VRFRDAGRLSVQQHKFTTCSHTGEPPCLLLLKSASSFECTANSRNALRRQNNLLSAASCATSHGPFSNSVHLQHNRPTVMILVAKAGSDGLVPCSIRTTSCNELHHNSLRGSPGEFLTTRLVAAERYHLLLHLVEQSSRTAPKGITGVRHCWASP